MSKSISFKSKNKIICFDTETTGLPKQISFDELYHYEQLDKYRGARVVQVAMLVFERKIIDKCADGPIDKCADRPIDKCKNPKQYGSLNYLSEMQGFHLIAEYNFIIKPDGFVITSQKYHNITQQYAENVGMEFTEAIRQISHHFDDCTLLVAHNINFDFNVLASEMYRYDLIDELKKFNLIEKYCTSKGCKYITKLKIGRYYKQPKLIELFNFLFGYNPKGLHDALQDTRVLAMCFFKLLERDLI